ncbi:MAG TPA: SURF1 family cytochrome oxidase biogenesis protein [Caulobacteraceae bacterium]|nr:SURF1 family cytochrome oxidase biogenesis protein [Caulobacteraceae bacterium]
MRRFPVGLTLVAGLAFAILIGLGVWQLRRLAWKQDLLARVAALRVAPARPAAQVLALAAQGRDEAYQRVAAECEPPQRPARDAYRYALRDGRVGWRLVSACRLTGAPYDGVLVDRGLVARLTGAMAPEAGVFPAPASVVGVLRSAGGRPLLGPAETEGASGARVFRVLDHAAVASLGADNGIARTAPYILAVESERPPPQGVVPAPLPQDIPNNHFVYALTWFALAGILAWFYGALLLRRLGR